MSAPSKRLVHAVAVSCALLTVSIVPAFADPVPGPPGVAGRPAEATPNPAAAASGPAVPDPSALGAVPLPSAASGATAPVATGPGNAQVPGAAVPNPATVPGPAALPSVPPAPQPAARLVAMNVTSGIQPGPDGRDLTTYTITLANRGTAPVTGLRVVQTLPDTFVNAVTDRGGQIAGSQAAWTVDLDPGAQTKITTSGSVPESQPTGAWTLACAYAAGESQPFLCATHTQAQQAAAPEGRAPWWPVAAAVAAVLLAAGSVVAHVIQRRRQCRPRSGLTRAATVPRESAVLMPEPPHVRREPAKSGEPDPTYPRVAERRVPDRTETGVLAWWRPPADPAGATPDHGVRRHFRHDGTEHEYAGYGGARPTRGVDVPGHPTEENTVLSVAEKSPPLSVVEETLMFPATGKPSPRKG
ncbi:hypothetical protein [Kitasatospora sp. NPDC086791]|uniref:hypothetical protein n=1 Tax=Kitasatospora sp. NPDC086791 TaxID=3155178 RepID=UPI003448E964